MKKLSLTSLLIIMMLSSLAAQSGTQLFNEGRDAFSDKLFSRSIESFREFIELYPSDPRVDQADYMIGVSLFYLRKFDQLIRHFDLYERNYPGSAYLRRIHYWKGLSYYGQNNFRSAIMELKKQSEIREETYFRQKSLQLLGYSYEKNEQYSLAGESYKALFDSKPGKELSALALERQGYIQLKLKNYRLALNLFEQVTVEYSDIPQVMKEIPFYQAECYFQLLEYNESLRKFETFLTLYSNSENREKAVFRLGTLHALMNNQDDAKEYMNLLTEEFPDSSYIMEAHIILAESYMADGNMAAARTSLNRLLEEENDPVEIQKLQFNMARTWEEDSEQALKWYLNASKGLDPDISAESLYRSGIIYENMEEPQRTVLLFEKLFNQYRNNEHREEVGNWIVLYYETNGQDLALKNHLDRMLTEYPDTDKRTMYLYMRGNISYREGKHNEALRYYQNILNVESEDRLILNETRYRIGYIYTLRKEFYRASDYFKEVLKTQPRDELYYRSQLSLGICYLNVKEYTLAEDEFREVADVRPNTAWTGDANFYLGKISMDKGSYSQAAKYYNAAVSSSESSERKIQSLYQLGWSYMRMASFREASESFDAVWKMDQNHTLAGDSLYRSGTALSYQELWEESLIRFRKALELIEYFSLREELLYQTAWSYFMLMDFDAAMDYLKQLEKEFPDSPLPADGLFRAAEALYEKQEGKAAVAAYISLYNEFPDSPLSETALYRALSLTEDMDEKMILIRDFLDQFTGNERALQAALQLNKLLKSQKLSENSQNVLYILLNQPLTDAERSIILLGQYYLILDQKETFQKLEELAALNDLRSRESENIILYKGIWFYHSGDSERGEEYFQDILKGDISEFSAEAQFYMARILEDREEWKKAADEYLRIRYRYPDQTAWVIRSLYQAALSYKKAGDTESYQRAADMLSESYPDSEYNRILEKEAILISPEEPEEETVSSDDLTDLESLSPPDEILPILEE